MTISDFFIPETTQIMQWAAFCERVGSNISEEKYIDIRYILTIAVQKLKISQNRLYAASKPLIPLLIDIALSVKKGCRTYYSLLRKKNILSNKIIKREDKWHKELDCVMSVDFWNSTRKLGTKIYFDNKLKWLQFQIIRNSLQTNYIVSHFKVNVSQKCQYCQESNELISHIYWSCRIVQSFLSLVIDFFAELDVDFTPNRSQILFGFLDLDISHPKNLICLIFKRYIWVTKFKNCNLSITGFKGL